MLPLPRTFGLFLAHYSRLLLFCALVLGAGLLETPWLSQSLFRKGNTLASDGGLGSEVTDGVLLFLGTLFFLVLLLCRMSIRFKGFLGCPARLTRALSRWLPRAMALVEVSAMQGKPGSRESKC